MNNLFIKTYVYKVANKTSEMLFISEELAKNYLFSFPASISGEMSIQRIPVLGNKDQNIIIED